MIKLWRKSVDFSPKSFFLDVETIIRRTFLFSELQCLPRGDLRNLFAHKAPTAGNSFIKVINCKTAENIITLYKEL